MGKRNTREPGLGDQALPLDALESPQFELDEFHAGYTIDEARKPEYHGLDINDFVHLDTKVNRVRIETFTAQWIGEVLINPPVPDHPAIITYKSSERAKPRSVVCSSVEAVLLGRNPQLFDAGVTQAIRQRIAEMQHPEFETIPNPPERWLVLQTYIDESIQPLRRINRLLYGASRHRNSNGEAAEKSNRLDLVQRMRTLMIHPWIDDLGQAAGWDERTIRLTHEVTDFRLFFHERARDRRNEWREWHDIASELLKMKYGVFSSAVETAKHRPQERMLVGRTPVTLQ